MFGSKEIGMGSHRPSPGSRRAGVGRLAADCLAIRGPWPPIAATIPGEETVVAGLTEVLAAAGLALPVAGGSRDEGALTNPIARSKARAGPGDVRAAPGQPGSPHLAITPAEYPRAPPGPGGKTTKRGPYLLRGLVARPPPPGVAAPAPCALPALALHWP